MCNECVRGRVSPSRRFPPPPPPSFALCLFTPGVDDASFFISITLLGRRRSWGTIQRLTDVEVLTFRHA